VAQLALGTPSGDCAESGLGLLVSGSSAQLPRALNRLPESLGPRYGGTRVDITLLCGDMANVSAQIIENMHVPVKDLARRSNGKRGWEVQATLTLKHMYHPRCQSRL